MSDTIRIKTIAKNVLTAFFEAGEAEEGITQVDELDIELLAEAIAEAVVRKG